VAALVLGLLIASAKSSYDAERATGLTEIKFFLCLSKTSQFLSGRELYFIILFSDAHFSHDIRRNSAGRGHLHRRLFGQMLRRIFMLPVPTA